ncbi:hypothetical protein D3C83_107470 [compost metagenome]
MTIEGPRHVGQFSTSTNVIEKPHCEHSPLWFLPPASVTFQGFVHLGQAASLAAVATAAACL